MVRNDPDAAQQAGFLVGLGRLWTQEQRRQDLQEWCGGGCEDGLQSSLPMTKPWQCWCTKRRMVGSIRLTVGAGVRLRAR